MPDPEKPIRMSKHAREQVPFRGATELEVIQAVRTDAWRAAELGRLDCRRNFPFAATSHGKPYATKQVRPIFVDEADEVVVVTVYVYYF